MVLDSSGVWALMTPVLFEGSACFLGVYCLSGVLFKRSLSEAREAKRDHLLRLCLLRATQQS